MERVKTFFRTMIRFLKKSVVIIVILGLVTVFSVWMYMRSNDAPILQGEVWKNIPYNRENTLDVYMPLSDNHPLNPVLIYFHGGAWVGGSKEALNFNRYHEAIINLRKQGYVVVSADYTLAKKGASPFPKNIQNAFQVLNWVEQNADSYQFDLQNIGVMGESAGAHLAMMTVFANNDTEYGNHSLDLRYLINVYGPNNLIPLYSLPALDSLNEYIKRLPKSWQQDLNITEYLFGFDPEGDWELATDIMKSYSPIHYLSKMDTTPVLIIHGDKDQIVPINQSVWLLDSLNKMQIPVEHHILPGVDHGFIKASAAQKDSVQMWITDFVLGTEK